ncbi:uncharacterized protein K444DRAFT_634285 [Hyaloscypha bicolor E]|uniref:Uncharacterized protein n=1 Tax=Hyaloscypha bicolor E TaxID=1095630 RepID=A0A2J6SUW5_9HELO|nr:uncharacterized protein K444DRAFT_634285 [Hyaloscypha bicolor E]PMD54564.1 hypothetical protein K444DRAFT_634285 [Hyaloscypha bicolor E]
MSYINYDTESLLGISVAESGSTPCYSEDSQPRICFDEYCTFPMGNMCKACRLDRVVRKKRVRKHSRVQRAREWVHEINVQKYITNYSGEVFLGGAVDRDELEENDGHNGGLDSDGGEAEYEEVQSYGSDEEDDCYDSDEIIQANEAEQEKHPGLCDLIPKSFGSDWDTHPKLSSNSERTSSLTIVSSRLSIRSDLSAHLELWVSDIFDRTLEGQMKDTIFIGGAEDDRILCPLCRNPIGDPKYQHLLQCQFAQDEQERMRVMWRR